MLIHHVKRWSCAAAKILQGQQTAVGRVHSCFDRTVNIRTSSGRLLTLQGGEQLQSPLALQLAEERWARLPFLPTGALVIKHIPGAAGAGLQLIFSGSIEWHGRIRPVPGLTSFALRSKADILSQWISQNLPGQGLVQLLANLQGSDHALSSACRRLYDALGPLLSIHPLSTQAMFDMVTGVVGLGDGLTPSGDDLFVGFLSVLHATGHLEAVLPSTVHQQFLQEVMARTSDLSTEFIRCAVEGDFAEPIALLVRSLFAPELQEWQSQARSLAAVGHNSGIDSMVGIVLGSRLMAHTRER